ncbi:MAG: TonB-dependent receptor [Halioglobus sp.]
MTTKLISSAVTAALISTGLLSSQLVSAQAAVLEEILVTARKRSENLQDVAASVSAISGESMRDMGAYDFRELGAALTNVNVSNDQDNIDISIRGISNNRGFAPATAFHVDGVYTGNGRSGLAAFVDVQRVEVIRGPAGTLYGRNATAGAVNVISNRPDLESSSLDIEATLGNDDFYNVLLVGNLAATETLGLRAAYMKEERDGWSKNDSFDPAIPDQETDDADLEVFKLRALWQPIDTISWQLGYDHFESGGAGRRLLLDWEKSIARGGIENGLAKNLTPQQAEQVQSDPRYVPANDLFSNDIEQDFLLSDFRLDLGWGEINYLLGHRELETNTKADTDFYAGNFDTVSTEDYEETSHELRLAGDTDSLKWLVGLYYWDSESDGGFVQNISDTLRSVFSSNGATSESLAAFTQVTWSLSDSLRLTGGLRYSEDEQNSGTGIVGLEIAGTSIMPSPYDESSGDWDDTSYKLALEFDLNDNSMLYAGVSTGYKTGGLNSAAVDTTFEPEEVDAYEIGSKNMLRDGRLQLNAAAFFYDYKNLQISGLEVINDQPIAAQTNIPKSEVYGAEVEWVALLTDSLKFDGGVGYLIAEAKEGFVDDPTESEGSIIIDISGNSLRKSPEWSVNLGLEHDWDLASAGSIVSRLNFHYEDEQYHDVVNVEQNLEDSFTRTDLTFTWRSADTSLFAQAFWRHLEDDDVRSTIFQTPLGALSSYTAPETYGLRVGYSFE